MARSRLEKIGPGEAVSLAVVYIVAKIFLTFPALVVDLGLSAAWLVVLVAILAGFVALLPLFFLLSRFPGKSIVDIGEEVAGAPANIILSLGYIAFFLAVESMVMRQFAERAITVSIPELPISVAMLGLMLGSAVACYLGLEAVARSTRISFIFVGSLFVLVIVLIYPYWDANNLFPLLGPGLTKLILAGLGQISIFSEIFVLAVLVPVIRLDQARAIWQLGRRTYVASGLIMVVIVITYLLTFPVPVAREIPLPTFEMTRLIFYGRFFQRLEPVFLPMWALVALLKLTIGLYALAYLISRVLKLPYYRPLILPLAVIITSVAFIPPNVSVALAIDEQYVQNWGWIPTFGFPALVLVVAFLRGRLKTVEERH